MVLYRRVSLLYIYIYYFMFLLSIKIVIYTYRNISSRWRPTATPLNPRAKSTQPLGLRQQPVNWRTHSTPAGSSILLSFITRL